VVALEAPAPRLARARLAKDADVIPARVTPLASTSSSRSTFSRLMIVVSFE